MALKNGFDGLDIDWEHPVNDGLPARPARELRPEDRANYVLLLRRLRSHLDRQPNGRAVLLTAATAGYSDHLKDFDLAQMSKYLDWFNLMIYDMSDMNPDFTAHAGAISASSRQRDPEMRERRPASAAYAVNWYLAHGVPRHKIILGVPFYGHKWLGVPPENDGLFQPYKEYPTEADGLAYRLIRPPLGHYVVHWDDDAKTTWAYDSAKGTMISFDDQRALTAKAHYIMSERIGGIMFWSISQDDENFDLLRTLASEIHP